MGGGGSTASRLGTDLRNGHSAASNKSAYILLNHPARHRPFPVLSTPYLATAAMDEYKHLRTASVRQLALPVFFLGAGKHDRLLWLSIGLFAAFAVPGSMVKK
jgi:hypothetical protein